MKRLISCVLALLYIMAGFASGTWILHGKEYRVDTLYHAYIGPGTTQTSIKLAGPVNLRVFYTTTDLKNENVDVRAIKHKDTLTGLGTVSNAAESHPFLFCRDQRRLFFEFYAVWNHRSRR